MDTQTPKVSIVIPVYNGANYMREAIDSALAQTYKNIEILVVNDGSTDDGETEKIALSYGDAIRYFAKENGGVSTALNLAIGEMEGDYFSWLSHDDLYRPYKISAQIAYLQEHNLLGKNVILYSNLDVVDKDGVVTSTTGFEAYEPNNKPEYAVLHGLLSGITMLIPSSAFVHCGNFDVKYRCIQDYLLFYAFLQYYDYIFMPDVLASTRVHSAQVGQVSAAIMEENNHLWFIMPKQLPFEKKVRLEGSEYSFYLSMHDHIMKFYPYHEAALNCKKEANSCLVHQTAVLNNYDLDTIIATCEVYSLGSDVQDSLLLHAIQSVGIEQVTLYLKNSRYATAAQLEKMVKSKEVLPTHSPNLIERVKMVLWHIWKKVKQK